MKRKYLSIILITALIFGARLTWASSETTNLKLNKPGRGDRNWGQTINDNMDLLDAAYGNFNSVADDMPEVYVYANTFNSTTGTTITLPKSVDSVNEYAVKVTPTSRAGAIGDIYVAKTTSNFTVKCSEANTTDTFSASVYYIGDVSAYGSSIYRKWYVSPDTGITDHGDTSETGSLAWVLNEIGATPSTVELPGNKTYQLKQNLTVADNIQLYFQKGAIIDTDFSIRDSNYEWYQNGATNEYYLQAAGGGNPNINMPSVVIEDNAQMIEGAAGSLAAGEWDWTDVNGLGYSTVYVRLSDDNDPDGKSADYVETGYKISFNGPPIIGLKQGFSGEGNYYFNIDTVIGILPQWWGAKADGSTNCSKAIQMAIDSATGTASGEFMAVYLAAGNYSVEDTIYLKTAPLIGTGGMLNTGVRIIWNGSAGETAFEKDSSHEGNNTFVWIENINFRGGSNNPDHWLDFSTNTNGLDSFNRLRELQFLGTAKSPIKMGRWINVDWEHLRFDNWGEYCIDIVVPVGSSQNLSTFSLDNFAADAKTQSALGFFHIDVSDNPLSNLGTFEVSNGRMEVNTDLQATNPGIFVMTVPAAGAQSRSIALKLSNVTFQDVSTCTVYVLYRNGAGAAGETIILENFRPQGVDGLVGGTVGSYFNNIDLPNKIGYLALNVNTTSQGPSNAFGATLFAPYASNDAWAMRNKSDTYDRVSLDSNGYFNFGSGSATEDIALRRVSGTDIAGFGQYLTANGPGTEYKIKRKDLTGLSGATVTWTNAIPAGTIVLGVTALVHTTVTGATGIDIGESGGDTDLFIDGMGVTAPYAADLSKSNAAFTAPKTYKSPTSIQLTAVGGSFTGGDIRVILHYIELYPPAW